MGMVALTYKVMPDSDVDDVSADDIAAQITALKDDVYDVQLCETKPLAFGLKFIQVHVVMNDGSGFQMFSKKICVQYTAPEKSKFFRWAFFETKNTPTLWRIIHN